MKPQDFALRLWALSTFIAFYEVGCFDQVSVEHTLRKREAHFDIQSSLSRWKLTGDAHISDGAVVLTRDQKGQIGGIWSIKQVEFPDWELEMEFQVPAKNSHLFGDGLVLWYVDDCWAKGNVFGYKDYFKGMGIFMDTYGNQHDSHAHNHPYISLMINDGTLHYDHDQDGVHTQVGGCEFPFRHTTHTASIRLRYIDRNLTLHRRMANEDYIECISLSDVDLPTHYYFGVTAATGDLSDEHRLTSFRLKQLNAEKALTNNRMGIIPRAGLAKHLQGNIKDNTHQSRFKRFIKVSLLSVIILGCIIFAVWLLGTYYYDHQRRSKRFY